MIGREKILMDNGWKFHYGDIASIRNRWVWGKSGSWNQGPESKKFDDTSWREVDLPVASNKFSIRRNGYMRIPQGFLLLL